MLTSADPVFRAIADPTRRKIIHLLSIQECSVKQLTASFDISQPAISQHLRELKATKLVTAEKVGLEQHYRLTAAPLREVFGWVSQYQTLFDPAGHAWAFIPAPAAARPPKRAPKKGSKPHGR